MNFSHPSISIVESRNAGTVYIHNFTIAEKLKEEAADYLLSLLNGKIEFTLTSSNEDSGITFRLNGKHFESMSGGHGYQGDWKVLGKEDMVKKIKMVAQFNLGTYPYQHGTIQEPIK